MNDSPPTYWCVVCGRELIGEETPVGNLFMHDDVEHPPMDFDEDRAPQ